MTKTVKIGTRKSKLALWQANHIKAALENTHAGITVELVGFTTKGDQWLEQPLYEIGDKSLFVKELEQAMLDGQVDLCVHSIKDMLAIQPPELCLAAICQRHDPRDSLVSAKHTDLHALPEGAVVGTSSLRRQALLLAHRPDLTVRPLRGNVDTRLKKLHDGEYDAIILAAAGLHRLELEEKISQYLAPDEFLPAIAQGAIGVECRSDDMRILELISPLHHEDTALCVTAERKLNEHLDGGCHIPLAGYATLNDGVINLQGLVAEPNGSRLIMTEQRGDDATDVGKRAADDLLAQGAHDIIEASKT